MSTPFRTRMPSIQFVHVSKSWEKKKKEKRKRKTKQNKMRDEDVTKIGRVFQAKADHLEKYFIFDLPRLIHRCIVIYIYIYIYIYIKKFKN